MGQARVDNLAVGELDPSGQLVREIYAKNAPLYGVYRTAKRVCVQFGDDPTLEQEQRAKLMPLGALRGDINALIDGWRASDRHRAKARRRRFDRGTADALILAIGDDAAGALSQLTAVRATIMDGRTAIGRFQYLGVAFAFVVLTYFVLWLTSFDAISSSTVTTVHIGEVLIAVAGGALGAFLSVAIGLRSRTVLPDLQWVANLSDAVLRMTVGIVAAAIFLCLLRGGFGLTFAPIASQATAQAGCDSSEFWMRAFALGFIGGFFERLVPDLLDKAAGSIKDEARSPSRPSTSTPSKQTTPTPSPRTAKGPDDVGDCLCNQPLDPADMTPDSALPPATGGVASPPPAPTAADKGGAK